jgi:hypothetical protein
MDDEGDEDEEMEEISEDEAEKPPTKITKKIMGQQRQYYYLKTVKTMGDLEKFKFKVM